MTPELQALSQRLEDVEKQVAHLEALVVEHSDTDRTEAARTINAQTFIVTDKHGVRRAELSMTIPAGEAEEQPWLGLFDANGNVRACLGVHGGLPWLEFYDADQKCVVNLCVDEHGPRIGLYYGNGKPGVDVALSAGGPRLALLDRDTKQTVRLAVSEYAGSIRLDGTNGQPGIRLSVSRDYWSWVDLRDASGKGQLSLKVTPSGGKELLMCERGEAEPTVGPSLKLAVTSEGPYLAFGKDNEVFWSAPQGSPTGQR